MALLSLTIYQLALVALSDTVHCHPTTPSERNLTPYKLIARDFQNGTPTTITGGAIAGIVIGTIVVMAILFLCIRSFGGAHRGRHDRQTYGNQPKPAEQHDNWLVPPEEDAPPPYRSPNQVHIKPPVKKQAARHHRGNHAGGALFGGAIGGAIGGSSGGGGGGGGGGC